MDIGGVNRIRTVLPNVGTEVRKNDNANPERDAQGGSPYRKEPTPIHLTPEQEEAALKKLLELPAFKDSILVAKIIRTEGKAPHIVVEDSKGQVIRNLPYQAIIDLYLERNSEIKTGRLLKRTA